MSISKLSMTRAACWQSGERCFLFSLGSPPAPRAETGGVCSDLGLISSAFIVPRQIELGLLTCVFFTTEITVQGKNDHSWGLQEPKLQRAFY